jgi:hypothetical protein
VMGESRPHCYPFFLRLVLISSSMLCWDLKVVCLFRVCLPNFYMHFLFHSMHSTGTSHLIFLDMMFLTIFVRSTKLRISHLSSASCPDV